MRDFYIIAAVDNENGIGKNGKMPWVLHKDIKYFSEVTTAAKNPGTQNAVITGRKTWESLPENHRPLPARLNIVISGNPNLKLPKNVLLKENLGEALNILAKPPHDSKIEKVFVIGGAQIFEEAINHPNCRGIFLTKIFSSFNCDRFFPKDLSNYKETSRSKLQKSGNLTYQFVVYSRSQA